MKHLYLVPLFVSGIVLTACSSQSPEQSRAYLKEANPSPVTRPCDKIDALINGYNNNFDNIKLKSKETRIGQIWLAKYHLVGDSCQIWSAGKGMSTYSCNVTADSEEQANDYFNFAKQTTEECLGETWHMDIQPRKDNKGSKVQFTNSDSDLTIASHMVPTSSLFKSQWTVYYYVGSSKKQR